MTGMTDNKAAEVLAELGRDGDAGLTARERHALAHASARLRESAGVAVGWPKRDAWGHLDFDHAGDKPTDADHDSLAEGESFVPVYLAQQPAAVDGAMAARVLHEYVIRCINHHDDAPVKVRVEAMREALTAALALHPTAAQEGK